MSKPDLKTKTRLAMGELLDCVLGSVSPGHPATPSRALDLSELEERILLSASPMMAVAEMAEPAPAEAMAEESALITAEATPAPGAESSASQQSNTNVSIDPSQNVSHEVVFLDTNVEDYHQLLNDLWNSNDPSREIEVVLLSSSRDGIDQISEALAGREDLDAIHIVSHGTDAAVKLGSTWLTQDNLAGYVGEIARWGNSLSADADLLFYGCDLAASSDGQDLIDSLATLTGADVAASNDDTGHTIFGADWVLEYATGKIEADIAFTQTTQDNWGHIMNVAVDATSTGSTTGSSITISHTTTSAADRLMLVGISIGEDSPPSVTSVTYNGASLTSEGSVQSADGGTVEIFSLVAPSAGTHDVVVTLGGNGDAIAGVMTFAGVNQSTPLGTFASDSGNGTSGSVAVSSAAGELVFGVVTVNDLDRDLVPGSGQTERWDLFAGFESNGGASTEAGAPSVDLSWSWGSNTGWAIGGISIRPASTTTITVNTTNDVLSGDADTSSLAALIATPGSDGVISLREAITAANNQSGTDTIEFEIIDALVSGAHTITPASALPDITDAVVINGTTDSDFSSTPIIVLDGNNVNASGLRLSGTADGSTIRGLVIRDFDDHGIHILNGSNDHLIAGNYIGRLNVSGTDAGAGEGNGGEGIYVLGDNVTIGGASSADRNIISGNGSDGIWIQSGDNAIVQGNFIGVEADGATALGNTGASGIWVTGGTTAITSVSIGGTGAGEGNIIANNAKDGITVKRVFASISGVEIIGNSIYNNAELGIDLADNNLTTNDSGDGDSGPNNLQNFPVLNSAVTDGSTKIAIAGSINTTASETVLIQLFANDSNDGTGHGEGQTYLGFTDVTTGTDGNATFDITLSAAVTEGAFISATATNSGGSTSEFALSVTATGPPNTRPSFGANGDGSVTTTIPGSSLDFGFGSVVQDDGKVIVAGSSKLTDYDISLVRYHADGSVDQTFGTDGIVTLDLGGNELGFDVALQSDGKIVVAGQTDIGTDIDLLTVRFNVDGSLDTSFDSDGYAILDITGDDSAGAVAIQPDGNIIVVGTNDGGGHDFSVVRYETTGALDTTFDSDGVFTHDFGGSSFDQATSVALQNDGKIIVGGSSAVQFGLLRLTTAGVLDTTFDTDGKVTTDFGAGSETINSLAIQADGKIIAGGTANLNFALARYNLDGSLDTTFDTDGLQTSDMGATEQAYDIALTSTEKILISGSTDIIGDNDVMVQRYNSDGSIDTTFNTVGTRITVVGGTNENGYSVNALNDGRVLVGGNTSPNGLLLNRYLESGPEDTTFGATTNLLDGNPTYTIGGAAVVLDADVSIFDAELSTSDDFNGTTLTLVRNGGNSSDDVFSPTGNLEFNSGNLVLSSSTIGTYLQLNGNLALNFTTSVTNAQVNEVMRSLAYSNTSGSPPISVLLNWTFNDQNSGDQGTGGAKEALGSTKVDITAAANAAPTLFKTGNNSTFNEGDSPVTVEGLMGLSDADSVDFDTGVLTVDFTANSTANDRLAIQNNGTGSGEVGIIGSNVTYEGSTVGTFSGGTDGSTPLVITFNTSSTLASVQAVLRHVTFENVSENPSESTRTVRFVLTDGDGGTSNTITKSIGVNAVNDDPVITSDSGGATASLNVAENSAPVTTVTSSDVDGGTAVYSITGGADSAQFAINDSTGVLTFVSAPDFESPTDVGTDNVYAVTVQVSDGAGGTDSQAIVVTVTNVSQYTVIVDTTSDVSDGTTASIAALLNDKGADGKISLREAILATNGTVNEEGGPDRIHFEIPDALVGGAHTIQPTVALPTITDAVIIDGTTDADFSSTPIIELDGSLTTMTIGLRVSSGDSTIRGLVINQFEDAIRLETNGGNTIAGNYIGTDVTGTVATGNTDDGIHIVSGNNTIGGTTAVDRNIISANNGDGIFISGADASGNVVSGNYIGIDATGTVDLGNGSNGVNVDSGATDNTIGGSTAGARNVLSGNVIHGVELEGVGTTGNVVTGNYIGTNAAGTGSIGNDSGGVIIRGGATGNTIGGTTAGERNLISGNSTHGIELSGTGTDSNVVIGNWIGTDATGTAGLANASSGVLIQSDAASNRIGGTTAGEGNTIAFNADDGINLRSTSGNGNSFLGNSIFSNTGQGIDLNHDGVTFNDAGDSDTGPNNLQNFPDLTSAVTNGSSTVTIDGSINTTASTTYRIEFFASTTADASSYGEAERYLGSTTVTTDGSGNASFSKALSATVAAGEFITATATVDLGGDNYGDTSEFAQNVTATPSDTSPTDLARTSTTNGGLSINTDGGNDAYLRADDGGAILGGLTSLTVETQFAVATPAANETILLSYAAGISDNEVKLAINPDGRLEFEVGDVSQFTTGSYTGLFDGDRHHVAVSWNGTGGNVVFYVDGAPVESFSGFRTGYSVLGGGVLVFGQEQDSVEGGFETVDLFQGTLYDTRIFNDVRSEVEIAADVESTLPYDEAGLIANWTFSDLSVDGVLAEAVSGNNLTVKHVSGGGFLSSTPALTFEVDENTPNGTVIGSVTGSDPEREALIADLLAADVDLSYSDITGKFYKQVLSSGTWSSALTSATGTTLNGINGQLVTIRSAAENGIVHTIVNTSGTKAWIGATDTDVDGEWKWYSGATPDDQFWQGDSTGTIVDGAYANWNLGAGQPDETDSDDDYAIIRQSDGEWANRLSTDTEGSFLVEWDADTILDNAGPSGEEPLAYSIQSQTVAGAFAINSDTGQITVADGSLLDYETNATHTVTVRVTDVSSNTYDEAFTVSLQDVNDAPLITSNGGADMGAVNVAENTTAVTTVTATDADLPAQTLSYSISGGADAARFSINSSTGALTFASAPDFESPTDAGGDNVYDVTVQVSDGNGGTDSQDIAVTVTDVSQYTVIVDTTSDVADGTTSSIAALLNDVGADGRISLREAILATNATANEDGGVDRIHFEIPDALVDGAHTIQVGLGSGTGLPQITDTVIIDGTSDADFSNAPIIELDGSSVTDGSGGLVLATGSDGSTIRGLVINSFSGTGSNDDGIRILTDNNLVAGNYIGTDVAGTSALANGADGIQLDSGASGNTIGGTTAADRNVVSGNAEVGIALTNSSTGNTIQGNYVGVGSDGTTLLGNGIIGIRVTNGAQATIGGTAAGAGNIVAGAGSNAGIRINTSTSVGTSILGNTVYSNNGLGIDLEMSGVDANDSGDADTGANHLQNYPVLTSATTDGSSTLRVAGTINTTASTTYRIEFFASTVTDPSGNGEAEKFLGSISVTTDGSGDASFNQAISATVADGEFVTATATVDLGGGNYGDTSEFAQNVEAEQNTVTPVITSNGGGATAAISVLEGQTAVTTVTATDADLPAQTLSYSITGGADAARFALNSSTGELTFAAVPDFDTPTDANTDNVYEVTVEVSDGHGGTDSQDLSVIVTPAPLGADSLWFSTINNVTGSGAPGLDAWNEGEIIALGDPNLTFGDSTNGTLAVQFDLSIFAADSSVDIDGIDYVSRAVTVGTSTTVDLQRGDLLLSTNQDETLGGLAVGQNDLIAFRPDTVGDFSSGSFFFVLNRTNDSLVDLKDFALVEMDMTVGGVALSAGDFLFTDLTVTAGDVERFTATVAGSASVSGSTSQFVDGSDIGITASLRGLDLIQDSTTIGGQSVTAGSLLVSLDAADAALGTNNLGVAEHDVFTLDFTTAGATTDASAAMFLDGSDIGLDTSDENPYPITLVTENSFPVITSNGGGNTAAINLAENTTAVTTVTATDSDVPAQPLTYSLGGGADVARFLVNSSTGELTFVSAPDFEAPVDSNTDNVYEVIVLVSDGNGGADTQAISVTVTADNDNTPSITSNGGGATASINVAENITAVTMVTASDTDLPGDTLNYSIAGGTDSAKFAINSSTGELTFASAPDFETPTDADTDNVYEVTVEVSDGSLANTQAISVTVTAINDNAPVITSDGGAATAAVNVAENTTAVTTVTATDADLPAQTLSYSITGGADAAQFAINSSNGELTFASAPDFEAPTDADTDNVYEVAVEASDGAGGIDSQDITVMVTPVNEAPIANDDSFSLDKDATLIVGAADWWDTDWTRRQELTFDNTGQSESLVDFPILVTLDSSRIDYSLTQNNGQDLRFIDGDGSVLAHEIESWDESGTSYVWVKVPQIDAGSDFDSIDLYYGNATASDGQNGSAVWSSEYSLVQHHEEASGSVTDSTANANDGTNSGADLNAIGFVGDGDGFNGTGSSITVSDSNSLDLTDGLTISGWINASSLKTYHPIVAKGVSSTEFNYYFATNSAGNGLVFEYRAGGLEVFDTGNLGLKTDTWYHVGATYDDVTNTVVIYLNGSQVFSDNSATAAMSADNGSLTIGTGPYIGEWFDGFLDEIRVENVARSGDWIAAQYLSMNDSLTSYGPVDIVPVVDGVLTNDSDPEGDGLTANLISGPMNADTFRFSDDGSFTYTPLNGYSGTDRFTYQTNDGSQNSNVATVVLTVGTVNDRPAITSNGGGPSAMVSVTENATAVTTVTATDSDLPDQTLKYTISGGADAAKFAINSSTGELTFTSAPDFESPTDTGADNTYEVIVLVSDGSLVDTQALAVAVTDVNEFGVSAISDSNADQDFVIENSPVSTTAGITAFASDVDRTDSVSYSLDNDAGGTFVIDSSTGVVTVADSTDREAAGSYAITVRATSTDTSFTTKDFTITIGDVDEFDVTAIVDSDGLADTVDENSAAGTNVGVTVLASDADATTNEITYSLDDNSTGQFAIDASTGEVTVAAAIDREAGPTRTITVRATSEDGSFSTKDFTIAINDLNEFDVTAITDADGGANSVNENAGVGMSVGIRASATDNDATTNAITYSLDDDSNGEFFIESSAGDVKVAGSIDREAGATRTITVRATSTDGSFSTKDFTIGINDLNDNAPIISVGQTFDVSEFASNGDSIGTAVATDADTLGVIQNWVITSGNIDEVFEIDATSGELRVADNAQLNFESTESYILSLRVEDGANTSLTQTVTINVVDDNDVPVLNVNAGVSVVEGGDVIISNAELSVTDGDESPSEIQYSIVDSPTAGRLELTDDPGVSISSFTQADIDGNLLRFVHDGSEADDSFTFSISDGNGGTIGTTLFSITNLRVNDAPVNSTPTSQTTSEDTPLVFSSDAGNGISVSDVDLNGNLIGIRLVATNGTLTLGSTSGLVFATGNGSNDSDLVFAGLIDNVNDALKGLTFVPTADYNGSAAVRIITRDMGSSGSGGEQIDDDTINITVTAINDNPVATDDEYSTNEDNALTVTTANGLLSNDSNIDGGTLSVVATSSTTNGALLLNADGSFVYTPNVNFNGVDSFTYRATDGSLQSETRTVTLNVAAVNDASVSIDDEFTIDQLSVLELSAVNGILVNDLDVEADELQAVLVDGPQNGRLVLNADGSLTYTPSATFFGEDTFTYRSVDGSDDGSIATVRIVVRQTVTSGSDGDGDNVTEESDRRAGDEKIDGVDVDDGTGIVGDDVIDGSVESNPGETSTTPNFVSPTETSGETTDTTAIVNNSSDSDDGGSTAGSAAEQPTFVTAFRIDERGELRDRATGRIVEDAGVVVFTSTDVGSMVYVLEQTGFWTELDTFEQDVQASILQESEWEELVVETTTVAGTTLTVGYIVWLLRSGSVVFGLVSSLPAWTMMDPLPVLQSGLEGLGDATDNSDDDSLQGILQAHHDGTESLTESFED